MRELSKDLEKIFINNFELKAVIGSIALAASWAFEGEYEALISIATLITFDFIMGTWVSIKQGTWCPLRSAAGATKFFRYLIYMLTARLVDKVAPGGLHIFAPLMDVYLAVTEAGSILEKFNLLGYPVPTIILNKLKELREKSK